MRICVFAGSSPGYSAKYEKAAAALGAVLAQRKLGLVYGGAAVGRMGALADATLNAGGEVIGVIPQALVDHEVAHGGLTELRIVSSMHQRKALMADLADGFIALPGGIGTLEEIFEAWTWTQLGNHSKPCGLLNISGFYDHLLGFADHIVDEGFLKRVHRDMLLVGDDPDALIQALIAFRVPAETKWLSSNQQPSEAAGIA